MCSSLSLCFYNTLDEDAERNVMRERDFCAGKKTTPSPSKKKPKNLFLNPLTIETLKTKIVFFFFRSFVRHKKRHKSADFFAE